jgi:hypothetical protein
MTSIHNIIQQLIIEQLQQKPLLIDSQHVEKLGMLQSYFKFDELVLNIHVLIKDNTLYLSAYPHNRTFNYDITHLVDLTDPNIITSITNYIQKVKTHYDLP